MKEINLNDAESINGGVFPLVAVIGSGVVKLATATATAAAVGGVVGGFYAIWQYSK